MNLKQAWVMSSPHSDEQVFSVCCCDLEIDRDVRLPLGNVKFMEFSASHHIWIFCISTMKHEIVKVKVCYKVLKKNKILLINVLLWCNLCLLAVLANIWKTFLGTETKFTMVPARSSYVACQNSHPFPLEQSLSKTIALGQLPHQKVGMFLGGICQGRGDCPGW